VRGIPKKIRLSVELDVYVYLLCCVELCEKERWHLQWDSVCAEQ